MEKGLKRGVRFLITSLIVLGIVFLAPYTISLSRGGFEDPEVLRQFQFYEVSAIVGFIIIFIGFILEFIIRKGDDRYGSGNGFFGIGEKPHLKIFRRFTATQLVLLSIIFFSIMFLIASTMGIKSLTGLRVLPKQQFTIFDSLLFSSFLIPFAENLVAGAVIVLALVGLRILARKTNMKSSTFITLALLISLLVGIFGISWHNSVYPDSEISKLIVFFFWTLGGFLTLLIGFFFIFAIMHLINNLFIDLIEYLGSIEAIFIYVVGAIILLSIIYLILFRGRLLGRKRIEET